MPIKILFFIEELRGGGAEKVLCNLINHMDQSRFDVTVQTVWKGNPTHWLASGIRYRYCYGSRNRFNQLRYRFSAALGLTYRLHVKDNYAIEAAYLEYGATKIMAASTNQHAKKLAWVHSDFRKKVSDPQALYLKTAKWYRRFNRIICVSETARDSFVSIFGMAEKTAVLYNTIDDREIRSRAAEAPDPFPSRLTVVAVGRLAPEKGFDRLIHAHRLLLAEGYLHDLWILGEGPERAKLEGLIAKYGLSASVRLLGHCDNPYPFMQAADLLVCSSLYEGFSSFVAEGLILGKPILTTDCSGMRELLGDSEYGRIVPNNERDFLFGLREMLSRPELREAYAAKAAARGRQFSAEALCGATERFFLSLLS